MFDGKPIIIVVWSPIGYETYLALQQIIKAEQIIMICARNFTPQEAKATLGVNHHFFSQNSQEIASVCGALKKIMDYVRTQYGSYVLFAPQMGNFYTRTLIESDLCERIYIYDEGSAAYAPFFQKYGSSIWMRGSILSHPDLAEYFKSGAIETSKMQSLYNRGVKFYEMNHSKLYGLVSLFPDAFPGFDKIQLPLPPMPSGFRTDLSDVALVLLPPYRLLSQKERLESIQNDIKKVVQDEKCLRLILKPHPSDWNISLVKYREALGIDCGVLFDEFAQQERINTYRESAFLGYGFLITDNNSTELYAKQLKLF